MPGAESFTFHHCGCHRLLQVLRCSFVAECEGRAGSNFWGNVIALSALYDLAPSFFDSLAKVCPVDRAGYGGAFFTLELLLINLSRYGLN